MKLMHAVGCLIGLVMVMSGATPSDAPIGVITRGGPDVVLPQSSTDSLPVRYGLGFVAQVGPRAAALFANLRVIGKGRTDFEDGCDAFVFGDLAGLKKAKPGAIIRNEHERDAATGAARFVVKYPAAVGFWPLGAKQPDGSPHPGAGTGFALCRALSFVGRGDILTWDMFSQPTMRCYLEVVQLAFDGRQVSVTKRDLFRPEKQWVSADGWTIMAGGLHSAIPDGSDLLMACEAYREGPGRNGVCRFRFSEGQWQPVSFSPVTSGGEPSLVRRTDGSLVFLTRPSEDMGPEAPKSIMLWTSKDSGATWQEVLRAPNLRPSTPVSVHATADGRVFVLANVPGMTNPERTVQWWHRDRARLALWQLSEGAAELKPAQIIRDAEADFGMAPVGYQWYVDHPASAIVRLADGFWHGLIAYRVMQYPAAGDPVGETPNAHTGCYVEEMPAVEPATPPWRF
jgi:hypothetical protein